jgi:flavin-dependent dehydrogenase
VTQLGDGAGGAPEWLRRTQDGTIEVISREGTTAQIDPLRFCRWLLTRCEEKGVTVTYPARAVGVLRDANGVLDRVRVSKDGVESTRMIYPPPRTWPCLQQASRKAHTHS